MSAMYAFLALGLVADGLRIRKRLRAVAQLVPSDDAVSPEHRFITAPGVVLDEATRRAASAFARSTGARVVDLVPGDLPAHRALSWLRTFDPEGYRRDRLGKGRTAGHAVLVEADVLERLCAGDPMAASPPADALAFTRLAAKLKRYASTATDVAIAPGLRAAPERQRAAVAREVRGSASATAAVSAPIALAVLGYGVVGGGAGGLAALAAYHAQPLLGLAGGPLRPRGLAAYAVFREVMDLSHWVERVREPKPAAEHEDERERLRATREAYGKLLEGGIERFFEPRAEQCPICASADLEVHARPMDVVQHKPGRFTLERCRACGHVFQNPRLSLEGLGFYYRDHYDGLNEALADKMFSAQAASYLARARAVEGLSRPERWLDVGGAQGHFCCAAREVWPDTRFDAVDFSPVVEEAKRRGWADTGYCGAFPALAPELAGSYDVVSMSHYLEHTRDPRAEIRAARVALRDGGLLFIEVPDPESRFARLFGRFWVSWYQPQHQHMLSIERLTRLLEEQGFSVVRTRRGEAHQPGDMMFGIYAILDALAPLPDAPWLPKQGPLRKMARPLVFAAGAPFMAVGALLDRALAPLAERLGLSNIYRVVARKGSSPPASRVGGSAASQP